MSNESRQAITNTCAEVLSELGDLNPSAPATNASLVAAIDDLIVARIADAFAFMDELKSMKSQGGLKVNYLEREERLINGKDWP